MGRDGNAPEGLADYREHAHLKELHDTAVRRGVGAHIHSGRRASPSTVSRTPFWAATPTIISSSSCAPFVRNEWTSFRSNGTPSPLRIGAVSSFTCASPSPFRTK